MDRLPRDVAVEKRHPDIVKLLDEYRVQSPGMCSAYATSPNLMPNFMPQKQTKKQRQRKSSAMKESEALSPHHQPNKVHLPPVKKSRKKKGSTPSAANGSPPKEDLTEAVTDLPPSYESATGMYGTGAMDMGHHPISQSLQELHRDMCNVDELVQNPWMDQLNGHMRAMLPPGSSPSSINSPPGTGSSTSSPLCRPATSPHINEHSPSASGSMGPSPLNNPVQSPNQHPMALSPKKSFPLSPTHLQALQHAAIAHHAQGSPPNFINPMSQDFNNMGGGIPQQQQQQQANQAHQQQQQQQIPTYLGEQFPTPPSQHSLSDTTPVHMGYFPGEQTLTPSPESPEGWSSSSPHSAHSGDWSDAVASPPQTRPQPQTHYHIQPKQAPQQPRDTAAYL